jgi:hypothetical protein
LAWRTWPSGEASDVQCSSLNSLCKQCKREAKQALCFDVHPYMGRAPGRWPLAGSAHPPAHGLPWSPWISLSGLRTPQHIAAATPRAAFLCLGLTPSPHVAPRPRPCILVLVHHPAPAWATSKVRSQPHTDAFRRGPTGSPALSHMRVRPTQQQPAQMPLPATASGPPCLSPPTHSSRRAPTSSPFSVPAPHGPVNMAERGRVHRQVGPTADRARPQMTC